MKKIIYLTLSLCLVIGSLFAQHSFVVQNGTASVFNSLTEAYDASSDGDTIYLPGGSFDLPAIDKQLVLIGVGYHPDSTDATYYTRINNAATFSGNCDSSFITGIHFVSNVTIGTTGDDAVDLTLFRCRINGTVTLKFNDGISRATNCNVSECIIDGTIDANLGSNNIIEKSIIRGSLNNFRESSIDRMILSFGQYSYSWGISFSFNNTQNCQIRNSIINYNRYSGWRIDFSGCINNNFLNNIFAGSITFPNGTNTGSNNLVSVPLVSVFDSIDGNFHDYSYNHDFHLKEGSPAIGAGTSGTDIGIFGGSSPFKEGGLPSNPHIRAITIADETNNGLLPVEIKVSAQDN